MGNDPVEWHISDMPVDYPDAIALMDARVAAIHGRTAPEMVWLLQHPPLYTAGTSARDTDLLRHDLPVYQTGRGGQYTWHGPGQRIAYVMLDLKRRQPDLRDYIWRLEEWAIRALGDFNLRVERRCGRVGLWVPGSIEKKIAAIGVRVRHWISFHGIAINVDPDLAAFGGIIPCGLSEFGVTSMVDQGLPISMADLDNALMRHFEDVFTIPVNRECDSNKPSTVDQRCY